jgi:hypothetical protein
MKEKKTGGFLKPQGSRNSPRVSGKGVGFGRLGKN